MDFKNRGIKGTIIVLFDCDPLNHGPRFRRN